MAHTVLGNMSATQYNATQDKSLTLLDTIESGTLLVAFFAGYGPSTPVLAGVSDTNGNVWDFAFAASPAGEKYSGIAWSRISGAMNPSDSVTIDMSGGHTRSFAVLRAYAGLGLPIGESHADYGESQPARTNLLTYNGAGRAVAIAFYPTEYSPTDFWQFSFNQVVNYQDATNVDFFTIGERLLSGSGGIAAINDIGFVTQWAITGVTFPEVSLPVAGHRARVITVM